MRHELRCRVCETVAEPEPVDACPRCDGPTDVTYDWAHVRPTREATAAGPHSLWRYSDLLPAGARVDFGAGWTPLVRAERLSEILGVELYLKLEGQNPTRPHKDRVPPRPGSRRSCSRHSAGRQGRSPLVTPAHASSRSTARTTTAGGSSSSWARSSRGASSGATRT